MSSNKLHPFTPCKHGSQHVDGNKACATSVPVAKQNTMFRSVEMFTYGTLGNRELNFSGYVSVF